MARQIIAQRESNFSIAKAVNEGKIIIVKNNLPDEARRMVATAIMCRIWTCVSDRIHESEKEARELAGMSEPSVGFDPYFLMVDECQTVFAETSKAEPLLSEARSKRLGLMLGTQYLDRFDDETQQAILQNCSTVFAMNTDLSEEARVLSKRFIGVDSDDLMNVPDNHALTMLDSNDNYHLVRLAPPYPPIHSVEEVSELVQQSTDRYHVVRQSGQQTPGMR